MNWNKRCQNSFVCFSNEKVIFVFVGLQYDSMTPNSCDFYDLCTFVAKFCRQNLRTFPADFWRLKSRIRRLFSLLECMVSYWSLTNTKITFSLLKQTNECRHLLFGFICHLVICPWGQFNGNDKFGFLASSFWTSGFSTTSGSHPLSMIPTIAGVRSSIYKLEV